MDRSKYRIILPFLLPAVSLYALFVLYPYAQAIIISLTSWRGLTPAKRFVGFANYERMLQDAHFWNATIHSLVLVVALPLVTLAIALFFAALLVQGVRGAGLYRGIFFLPQVMSTTAVAVLWTYIYHPTIGLVNNAAGLLHLDFLKQTWLGDPSTALPAIGAVVVWQSVGFYMVFFTAGMKAIPTTLFDAARIDGAGRIESFRYVTFPLIWGVVRTALIHMSIGTLAVFTIIFLMTAAGPNRATDVLGTYLYEQAFVNGQYGYSTAIGTALMAITMGLSILVYMLTRRDTIEY